MNKSEKIKRSYSHERHVEAMIVADPSMAKYHNQNLRSYILTLMAAVSFEKCFTLNITF